VKPSTIYVVRFVVPFEAVHTVMAFASEADANDAAAKMQDAHDGAQGGKFFVSSMKLHHCVPAHPKWN
jgi:hypothetical protein